ncbi:hypothetical protein ACFY12_32090 [Streptomyces sp. NPDC001339]|uniref:hypothetical protein n=1 Tax=Streptomyces sp. NPDC001339 TaxID=3364563 RepID=UPI0036B7CB06
MKLTFVNLDTVPPTVLGSNSGASFWINFDPTREGAEAKIYGLNGGFFTTKPTVALWEDTRKPTQQRCADLIAQQGSETLPVAEGGRFCVRSAKGRVAMVAVGAYSRTREAYMGKVTVWPPTP